jgi:DnaK suppressor protein
MAEATGANCRRLEDQPYMNPQQKQYFKNKLLRWRSELCASLNLVVHPALIEEDKSADWIDSASLQTQVELNWANRERALRVIKEIDAALARIREGTYGFCIETGEEIGIKRLIALPIAQLSVAAQEKQELRRRHYR